ncbi:MAG: PAS domain S-box protein [bacterium]|nr:PAS domain S-box protein [bacterium]
MNASSPNHLRIVLIEDNDVDVLAFHRSFVNSRISCEIREFGRAEDALEKIRTENPRFHLVVTDQNLPGMSGLQLCKTLISEKINLPLVLLTGTGSEQLAAEALKAGVNDYIVKDHEQGYLDLLPVVLPEVVRKHNDYLARKRSEEALIESEKKYRTLFETSADGILITELDSNKIKFANSAFCKLAGYSEKELKALALGDLHPKNKIDDALSRLEAHLRGEKVLVEDFPLLKKNAGVVYVDISGTTTFIDGKNCCVDFFRDITERKQAEEEMKFLSSITRQVSDAVIVTNLNFEITYLNRAAEELYGYPVEEVLGKRAGFFSAEPLEKDSRAEILRTVNSGGTWEGEFHQKGKDGRRFIQETMLSSLTDHQGNIYAYIGVMRDITSRKQVEEALTKAKEEAEAASKAKSRFVANMSHEIRTPMNAVIGFSELLEAMITDKDQKYYLDAIKGAGKSLLTLINDILDLSKIEAERLEIRYEVVNPYSIFSEIERVFDLKMSGKSLKFIVDIDKTIPQSLMLDEARLRQVLLNLIGNAVKFTEAGYVKLSVLKLEKPGETDKIDLVIAVEDTGIGIPEDQLGLIFEYFSQRDGQNARKYGGAGLGLAISLRLAEMMNGRITVDSKIGRGSVFTLYLQDVALAPTTRIIKNKMEPDVFDLNRVSFEKDLILVVDDVLSNRQILSRLLVKTNLETIEAENGKQALIMAEERQPRLILMDLRMPVMDGYEATRRLKKNPKTKDIPVFAISASVTGEALDKIHTLGFTEYLPKPVNVHDFFQEISKYLKPVRKAGMEPQEHYRIEEPGDIHQLPDLLRNLKGDMMTMWSEVIGVLVIGKVEDFARKIKILADKHNAQTLSVYAEGLHEAVRVFDVQGIDDLLKGFPDIVEAFAA